MEAAQDATPRFPVHILTYHREKFAARKTTLGFTDRLLYYISLPRGSQCYFRRNLYLSGAFLSLIAKFFLCRANFSLTSFLVSAIIRFDNDTCHFDKRT